MPLIPRRKKQEDMVGLIQTAAERHRSGLQIETHHRLASEPGVVSPRKRDQVMGSPHYYCEVLPIGEPTGGSATAGTPTSVDHQFNVWLAFEFEEHTDYAGSTQETFDEITSSLDPKGVLPELRAASTRTVDPFKVTYLEPSNVTVDVAAAGQRGGEMDRIHVLDFNIILSEPS